MFRMLMGLPLLRPILRPVTRLIVGVIAIPLFRGFLRHVVRLQDLDEELEKDLEQWFRGALLLLVATRNMEETMFGWVQNAWDGDLQWVTMGLRLMLAIGVVQSMPDQELFAVIHPGPQKMRFRKGQSYFLQWWQQVPAYLKGVVCQHINRSSPVFAILAAIAPGWIGWLCYGVALFQYLIIGLVTSRDRAIDVLSVFDEQVKLRRDELIREFDLESSPGSDPESEQPVSEDPESEQDETVQSAVESPSGSSVAED